MINIDWNILLLGLVVGAAVSALFFAGLAYGMRIAFGTARPASVLLLSAALRIVLLLAAGWFVVQAGAWALGGFAISFLLVRFIAIIFARPQSTEDV